MRKTILYSLFILLAVGCKHEPLLSVTEIVKQNPQLDVVLQKYESDTLKRIAAEFFD